MEDAPEREEHVAGGGLLHRRALLFAGAASAGGWATGLRATNAPASMLEPGMPLSGYGVRAKSSEAIQRIVPDLAFPGSGSSRRTRGWTA
ncbi:hypothetical protein [Sphingomonas abietis]|uniref:Uncharacterized protein n=1 Tax=Sphingomonas abietis TaxID=3012344 RepID=A0ABY7NV07_9SPHN|nr:hypothetical protein [Sphingomonas abietis]WBO23744.1 hypothetical protein PBT88_06375 [Sphingomonas abietis]